MFRLNEPSSDINPKNVLESFLKFLMKWLLIVLWTEDCSIEWKRVSALFDCNVSFVLNLAS